jgi:hypothetical protein
MSYDDAYRDCLGVTLAHLCRAERPPVRFDVEINQAYMREPQPMRLRTVLIPAERADCCKTHDDYLNAIFEYGQNDFQPQRCPSVSVGDVIRLGEGRFRVSPVGFERIS